jgi:integrase
MSQRKQSGYIYQRGGWWVLRYREDVYENETKVRRQMAKQLAPVAPEHKRLKRPPAEVQREAEQFLSPFNREPNLDATRSMRAFVEGFYLPHVKSNLRASTYNTYKNIWEFHLAGRCGDVRLRDFTTYDGEQLLQTIARQHPELSKPTLKLIKVQLSAIFKQAKRLKFTADNPMRDTSVPNAPAHGRATGVYGLEEIWRMLAILPEPDRSIVGVAAFSGLRRGEIRGLEWPHYLGQALDIRQSIYAGVTTAPKSEASQALVPVIAPLKRILDEHHARCGSPATGFIFAAQNGKSLCLINTLRRMLPVFRAAGIEWRGWHAFRRGLATVLHDLAVDDITIQHILRHSDVSVTRSSYIKTLPQQTVDGMDKVEKAWEKVASTLVQ